MRTNLNTMRLRYLALMPGLVLGVVSLAQSTGLGIKGGVLMSTVHALNIRTSPIPGATVGFYLPWGIGPRMELQPEAMLTSLGAVYNEPDGDRNTVRSLYVQIPIALKCYLSNGFNLSGGYQFGKILLAQQQGTEGNASVTDQYNALDMGFVFGAGMDYESGLDLSARVYGAMTPSLRDDDAIFPKNRSLQVTVGYRFVQFGHRKNFR